MTMDFQIFTWGKDIIAIVLVLGGLIFFHELGHFSVAKLFGIGVETFSLGFGPKLLRRRYGKTDYCLSAIPLGGYVSLVGEAEQAKQDDEYGEEDDDDSIEFTEEEEFFRRPAWQKLLVVFAGPFFNFLLAFLLIWGLSWIDGEHYLLPEIGKVAEDSPAAASGILAGDVIQSINGRHIEKWETIPKMVNASGGQPMTLIITRSVKTEKQSLSFTITPKQGHRSTIFGEDEITWLLGIQASEHKGIMQLGLLQSCGFGLQKTWETTRLTCIGIVKLFQRVVPLEEVGGPILIGQMIVQNAEQGIMYLFILTTIISINLGVLNLLPVPVLDGGHIVFFLIEMIKGSPLSIRIRTISTQIGMGLLLLLMLLATWNDISRLFL